MTTENTAKRPSHRVFHEIKSNGKTIRSLELGAIWPHRDGRSFSMKLDYVPLGGGWLTIRSIDESKEGAE